MHKSCVALWYVSRHFTVVDKTKLKSVKQSKKYRYRPSNVAKEGFGGILDLPPVNLFVYEQW